MLSEPISYEKGLEIQESVVQQLLDGVGGETLLLLEHEPVYTIGRLRDRSSLRSEEALPAPLFETNRGGQATYHGPGQLVGYPILDLRMREKDLHLHLRLIEDSLIKTCREDFLIPAQRRDGLTGVWVEDRKLASIGVGVKKWISMHGFAINVTQESLLPFFAITPCGLSGVTMTSVESELGKSLTVKEFSEKFSQCFTQFFVR